MGALDSVSCPTPTLCVATGFNNGRIAVSKRPTGTAKDWAVTTLASNSLSDIACPAVNLCAAVDGAGRVVTSSAPQADARAWTATALNPSTPLTSIACPSPTRCIALSAGHDLSRQELHGTLLGTLVGALMASGATALGAVAGDG